MKEKKTVSIVILNYNGKNYTIKLLDSIRANVNEDVEVIVVDNGSSDGSIRAIKEQHPWVNLISLQKNFGFSKANNIGVRVARGSYVLVLNNDTLIEKGAIESLLKFMEENPDVGIVQPILIDYKNHDVIGNAGEFIDIFGHQVSRGAGLKNNGQYSTSPIFYAIGAAMFMKRNLFLKLGGFDEDYFMWFEDLDLCWRAWLNGYKVALCPSAIVYHYGSATNPYAFTSFLKAYHHTKNHILTLLKNCSAIHILSVTPILFIEYSLLFIEYVFKCKLDNVKGIIQGFLWNLLNLKSTIEKRRRIFPQKNSYITIKNLMIKHNLFFEYLINKDLWRKRIENPLDP